MRLKKNCVTTENGLHTINAKFISVKGLPSYAAKEEIVHFNFEPK